MIIERHVGFDPTIESNYLASLDNFEVRKKVLESEIATAVGEVFLNKFERNYSFVDGKIFDDEAKRNIEGLLFACGRQPEIEAIIKIQKELEVKDLVIHFSAKNEEYDYPSNCVDFWWRNDFEVRWMRVMVEDEFTNLNEINSILGGEKKENVMDLLANPIGVNDYKIGDILMMLNTVNNKNNISNELIREKVRILMDSFVEKFDDEISNNPEVIFRLFSAAVAEAEKDIKHKNVDISISNREIDLYLESEMSYRMMETGGCASENIVGDFSGGLYLIRGNNGDIQIVKGEVPEGFRLCTHCGLYYDGDSCPVCH